MKKIRLTVPGWVFVGALASWWAVACWPAGDRERRAAADLARMAAEHRERVLAAEQRRAEKLAGGWRPESRVTPTGRVEFTPADADRLRVRVRSQLEREARELARQAPDLLQWRLRPEQVRQRVLQEPEFFSLDLGERQAWFRLAEEEAQKFR